MIIRITKVKRLMDSAEYQIYIDDVYRGYIEGCDTMEFEVENGRHTVYAKVGWYRSKELYVDVNDSIVDLELDYVMTWWEELRHPLRTISYYYFRRDELLTLKVKDPTAEEKI